MAEIGIVNNIEHAVSRMPRAESTELVRPRIGSPRLILDMTDLIGQLTPGQVPGGIHRVIFEVANAGVLIARERGVELVCGCFDQASGAYLQYDPIFSNGAPSSRPFDWLFKTGRFQRTHPRPINLFKLKAKHLGRPIKGRLQIGYASLRLLYRHSVHRFKEALNPEVHATRLKFRQGDVLLMLGSGWDALPVFNHIQPFKNAGIITAHILVHDLIPVLNLPGETTLVPSVVFRAWLDRAVALASSLITYSASTRNDLVAYLSKTGQHIAEVSVVTLPHEFCPPAKIPMSQPVQDILSADYALFVGPVGGRKNAWRLLEAWAKVLGRLGPERTPLLVITDRRGADEVYDTHIRPIASHVRLLDRPADWELSNLYSAAAFTVFPSLYEGWGLPVGESLWHGTPCITSDASSLPEVGGPLCDYVDPTSVDSIATAVERFAGDRDYRDRRAKAIRREDLRTWRDFASDVIEAALSHSDRASERSEAEAAASGLYAKPARGLDR